MTFMPPDSVQQLATRHLGREIWLYDRLDSTNSQALLLAQEPARHGLILIARDQSAGRGQYGRSWQAEAGSSVLMTVLLFPPPVLRRVVLLTAWAAVAVSEAVQTLTGQQSTIKWPNDVYLAGKKICGILIEQRNTGLPGFPLATAVGIGLNVTQSEQAFLEVGLSLAGSLHSQTGYQGKPEEASIALVERLDDWYGTILAGETSTLEAKWREALGIVGREVRVETLQGQCIGEVISANFDGVRLRHDGKEIILAAEAIRHIRPRSSDDD